MRIDQAPDWSHPSNNDSTAPPDPEYFADWERFLREATTRGKDSVEAYEIWNEPNLAVSWGGKMPDPAGYSSLLQTAYWAIKQGDPNTLVVSAGLARTDEQSTRAMDNVVFLRKLYDAGARPYFDVLGSHPNGGSEGPSGSRFLKAEEERRTMEAYGDGAKKVWATEVFWTVRPPEACSTDFRWADRLWETVDAAKQAQYLAESSTLIQTKWPWMEGLFVFNLDFSLAPWYDSCEPMTYESILEQDGTPRRAFYALRDMSKQWNGRSSITAPTPEGASATASPLYPCGPLVPGSSESVWVFAGGVRYWCKRR